MKYKGRKVFAEKANCAFSPAAKSHGKTDIYQTEAQKVFQRKLAII
jgi:hypothetical protein